VISTRRRTGSTIVLASLLALGLAGCGGGNEAGRGSPQSEAPTTEGMGVTAKAGAVTVTYYYLPG
jgi:ABC-type glycerol-3-phosphate transport system substrate-binding protein